MVILLIYDPLRPVFTIQLKYFLRLKTSHFAFILLLKLLFNILLIFSLIQHILINIIKYKLRFVLTKSSKLLITFFEWTRLKYFNDCFNFNKLVVYKHLNQEEKLFVFFKLLNLTVWIVLFNFFEIFVEQLLLLRLLIFTMCRRVFILWLKLILVFFLWIHLEFTLIIGLFKFFFNLILIFIFFKVYISEHLHEQFREENFFYFFWVFIIHLDWFSFNDVLNLVFLMVLVITNHFK